MLFYIYLHFPFRKSIEIDYWKQKLFEALGANEGAYKRLLKDWFIKKCSREQLEMSVRFMFISMTSISWPSSTSVSLQSVHLQVHPPRH